MHIIKLNKKIGKLIEMRDFSLKQWEKTHNICKMYIVLNSAWGQTCCMYRKVRHKNHQRFHCFHLAVFGVFHEEAFYSNPPPLHIWMTLMSLEGCQDPAQAPPVSVPTVLLKGGFDPRPTVKRSQVNQPPAYATMTVPALPSTLRWALVRAHLLRA